MPLKPSFVYQASYNSPDLGGFSVYDSRSTLGSCCSLRLYMWSGKKADGLPLSVLPAPNTPLVFCRLDLWGGRKKKKKKKNQNPKKQS